MKKQKKPPTRKHKEKLEWIGHLSDADEVGIDNTIEDWAAHIRAKGGWEPGRWRKTTTLTSPQIQLSAQNQKRKEERKRPGTFSAAKCWVLAAAEYVVELSKQESQHGSGQRTPVGVNESFLQSAVGDKIASPYTNEN